MMKNNIRLKNELLKILLTASNHTLQAYTLNKRLGISTNIFFNTIFELAKENYISIEGLFIRLLDTGVQYIFSVIEHEKRNKSRIPKKFLSDTKIGIDQFYVPKRSLL